MAASAILLSLIAGFAIIIFLRRKQRSLTDDVRRLPVPVRASRISAKSVGHVGGLSFAFWCCLPPSLLNDDRMRRVCDTSQRNDLFLNPPLLPNTCCQMTNGLNSIHLLCRKTPTGYGATKRKYSIVHNQTLTTPGRTSWEGCIGSLARFG